jgi:Flp pilus assembly protein CpaB
MRRGGRLLILIALLLIVISAAGLLAVFLITRPRPGPGPGETLTAPIEVTATAEPVLFILRAAQDLPRGVVIPTNAIDIVPWPTSLVPTDAFNANDPTAVAQVVNSRARITIARGMPIFSTMLVRSLRDISPAGSDAAAQIPPGFVAITIPYDRRNGVAFGVKDGDSVNVIVSWAIVDIDPDFQSILPNNTTNVIPSGTGALDVPAGLFPFVPATEGGPVGKGQTDPTIAQDFYVVPSEAQRPRMVTQAIIQSALVLHVGDFPEISPFVLPPPTATQDPNVTPPPPPPATATPLPPDLITLVVSPQDALVLNFVKEAMERYPDGVNITLALRSAGDTTLTETESVTLQYMFERFNITLPAKLPYGLSAPSTTPQPTTP